MSIYKITDDYFVTGQITAANLPQIAEMGFKSIICNRPDGEGMMQPAYGKIEEAAQKVGIQTKYMPVSPGPAQQSDAAKLATTLKEIQGPVLAYCASGNRAANLWNMCQTGNNSNQSAA